MSIIKISMDTLKSWIDSRYIAQLFMHIAQVNHHLSAQGKMPMDRQRKKKFLFQSVGSFQLVDASQQKATKHDERIAIFCDGAALHTRYSHIFTD